MGTVRSKDGTTIAFDVASSTLDSVDQWSNSALIKGSVADFVAELRQQQGGTIGTGGPSRPASLASLANPFWNGRKSSSEFFGVGLLSILGKPSGKMTTNRPSRRRLSAILRAW